MYVCVCVRVHVDIYSFVFSIHEAKFCGVLLYVFDKLGYATGE